MMDIQQASFRRTVDHNGRMLAEVEVVPFEQNIGNVTVYVAAIPNGGFEIVQALPSQSNTVTSYEADAGMAQVMSTADSSMFVSQDFGLDWNAKSQFLDNLLSCDEVRCDLEKHLGS
ncbi:hypothetical protein MH117_22310 [Paenibacillus sp. ACRRX]|uniref:hypothetical protein n=1 Tax=unclassified Paenibacillus TaxID=185978 RepID=UPI001EF4583D|nr:MULTISPECIES: hypothetical protein [unclassified Paenibacillus]MCG7410152.1 hypothetical protein [Paenibacillus sp. ACRRX]MDK8183725.1 hypothetical protein [Paenibacillus sp. UMB4589-SE434]